ncbi:hypothetical protein GCM10009784_08340 [Arthrobacter parietis]|uniref:Uncharacterized protein n=1 Tax=Arthrobacter parietis TaxID=271434 RepID=A0ABN3AQS0_9MICC
MFSFKQWLEFVDQLIVSTESGTLDWLQPEDNDPARLYYAKLNDTHAVHLYSLNHDGEADFSISIQEFVEGGGHGQALEEIETDALQNTRDPAGEAVDEKLQVLWDTVVRKITEPDEKFEEMVSNELHRTLMQGLRGT